MVTGYGWNPGCGQAVNGHFGDIDLNGSRVRKDIIKEFETAFSIVKSGPCAE
jgi:hypothetical protein